jgi:hypothetical protein
MIYSEFCDILSATARAPALRYNPVFLAQGCCRRYNFSESRIGRTYGRRNALCIYIIYVCD